MKLETIEVVYDDPQHGITVVDLPSDFAEHDNFGVTIDFQNGERLFIPTIRLARVTWMNRGLGLTLGIDEQYHFQDRKGVRWTFHFASFGGWQWKRDEA